MQYNKKILMASAAACALISMGITSNDAKAFDEVNWTWEKDITENITRDIAVTVAATPASLSTLEKMQIQLGDVTATSTVTGVENNAVAENEGTIEIDETITVSAIYGDPDGAGNTIPALSGNVINQNNGTLTATYVEGTGQLSEGANGFTETSDVQITATIDASELGGTLDAVDLPLVNSAATAVGNNQSIETAGALDLHDGQFLAGTISGGTESVIPEESTGNTMQDIAAILALGAAQGSIAPATVSADSTVSEILNAAVNSQATAVGNNMNVDIAAGSISDAMMMADITQYSHANISGTSSVSDVTLDGYTNFGGADLGALAEEQLAVIDSSATAVGNNLAITVGIADTDVDTE